MYQLIFDFDGTLVDSFDIAIKTFNFLASEYHYKKIDLDEIDHLKDLTSIQLIKYFEIPFYQVPTILKHARKIMRDELLSAPPVKNIPETLCQFKKEVDIIGVLTSNSSNNVTEWLKFNNLYHIFRFIHVESSYFGKQKILKKILKLYQFEKSHTYYIGDETRDIDAAKSAGINSVAVSWGFNSEKILLQQQPDYLIKEPAELLSLVSSLRLEHHRLTEECSKLDPDFEQEMASESHAKY